MLAVRNAALLALLGVFATASGEAPRLQAQQQPLSPRPGFPSAPPRDVQPTAEGTATLRGRVTQAETGAPLRRAYVMARSGQQPQAWGATTDADGRYELADLPVGRYTLSARKAGYVNLQYGQRRVAEPGTPLELRADQVLDTVDFRLPRGGVVTGRVFDEFSEPVADAFVTVLTQRYQRGTRELVPAGQMGRSDDRGQFRVYGLPPGQYWVSASAQDFQSRMAQSSNTTGYAPTFYPGTPNAAEAQRLLLDVGQELTGIDFVLVPVRTAHVSGFATDAQGRPFANAVILVQQQLTGMFTTGMGSMTDAMGAFVVSNLPPGTYTLRIQDLQGGFDSGVATTTVTVNGADIDGIVLAATRGTTARGVIVTEDADRPSFTPSRLQVIAQPVEPLRAGFRAPARVGDDWTVELRGLTGNELIRVMGLPPEWGLKAVRLRGVDVTDRPLTAAEMNRPVDLEVVITDQITHLTGTVTDARGEPTQEYTVVVFADDPTRWSYPSRFVRTGRPDQEGVFKIEGLPAGRYAAVAADYVPPQAWTAPEYLEQLSPWTTSVELREGETESITLRVANLEGAIR